MGLVFLALACFNGTVAYRCLTDAADAYGRGWMGWVFLLSFGGLLNFICAALELAAGLSVLFS